MKATIQMNQLVRLGIYKTIQILPIYHKLQRKIQTGSYVDLGKLYPPDTPHAEE